jgi:hypothetical protein
MSSHQPQGPGNGPPSAGMSMQHQQGIQQPPAPSQSMSQQNLNQIVRSYLFDVYLNFGCSITLLCFALFMLFDIMHYLKHKHHEKRSKFAQRTTRLHLI